MPRVEVSGPCHEAAGWTFAVLHDKYYLHANCSQLRSCIRHDSRDFGSAALVVVAALFGWAKIALGFLKLTAA